MNELARLPADDRSPNAAAEAAQHTPSIRGRFYAFLSYSHDDSEFAEWLHSELEQFRVPRALTGKLTANGVVPKRLTPIFRDQHDLAATGDLGGEIKATLAASQFLIVLCSPTAAVSRWTNAEIEWFKQMRPDGCVLAAIVAGEPFASEMPGREAEECFPPALRFKYDRRGRKTANRAEPLAADFREGSDGKRTAFLKLVAGMLGVGLDDLVQRETTRRQRRLAWLAAASVAGMAVTSTLAFTAIQARDAARDQRREAEGLVAFMLGDLKDKLEPIGRLDALDGVGSRVLAYYSKQDTSELSDAALLQRSKALSLTAKVTYLRGNLGAALRLYNEALSGTGEAIRRNPDDPQRLFDHAQNVFWIGELQRLGGNTRSAEGAAREYRRLALQMVSLQPDNMRWRMEEQDADAELGIVLYDQRRFDEAASQFEQSLRTIEGLTAADPTNGDYQKARAECLAWIADSKMSAGKLAEATAIREQHVALLSRLMSSGGSDVEFRQKLVPAEQALGRLYAMRGQLPPALQHFRKAVNHARELLTVEPDNTLWMELEFKAQQALALYDLSARDTADAAAETNAACSTVDILLAQNSQMPSWRAGQRDCELLRAQLALASGANEEAVSHAQRASNMSARVATSDRVADRYALARSYRVLGDAQAAAGRKAEASTSWTRALSLVPQGVTERPLETDEHATILDRMGRSGEARALTSKLDAMGYRRIA